MRRRPRIGFNGLNPSPAPTAGGLVISTDLPAWKLSPLQSESLPPVTDIPADGLTLGRDPSCGYIVPAAIYPGVSAHHARVRAEDDGVVVEDLDSKNGTLVNDRAIDRAVLKHGDIFELGPGGPRFVVLSPAALDETIELQADPDSRRQLGTETMHMVRQDLGIPEGGVDVALRQRSRRSAVITAVVILAIVGGLWTVWEADSERQRAELTQQIDEKMETGIQAALEARFAGALAEQQARLDEARLAWEADKRTLAVERDALMASIHRLESEGQTASAELADLRERLDDTTETLELYDPVNLEQGKLERVSQVEEAVVLIDASLRYREKTTGRLLYQEPSDDPRSTIVNFENIGEPLELGASGSGFCISPDGWIVTNAHVVLKKGDTMELDLGPTVKLIPEVRLTVTFSGESKSLPARLVSFVAEGEEDLALLKIEPFDDMPHLGGRLHLDLQTPPRGTEVYLIGFPLGKQAMQQGDTMLASTFRGIVSRRVGPYLQVDAAVHPGNSGGPVIDGQGNILGVVTGMQILADGSGSSAIGYVIPVEDLDDVWPPDDG